ncbi:hypothetical protein QVD17_40909 [Tagetes erecta]|uniref:Uncharacterized protein n=1 Tax=Tagetes erecta TaxID=13708 RepID=A0AAD8NI61_TARER|nr:hypothetical protein QVD17_40909 [Tagetes erecta]
MITSRPIATVIKRSLQGCWTRTCHTAAEDVKMKKISDKQLLFQATLLLDGVEACELKSVLSLVQKHMSVLETRRAVTNHLTCNKTKEPLNDIGIFCHTQVLHGGYEASDVKTTIEPWIERHTTFPLEDPETVYVSAGFKFKAGPETKH